MAAVHKLSPGITTGLDWTRDGASCLHFNVLGPAPLRPSVRAMKTVSHDRGESPLFRWALTTSVVVGLFYILSLGPILRYTSRSVVFVSGTVQAPSRPIRIVPHWVSVFYFPMFRAVDVRTVSTMHEPLRTYEAYLQWWRNRP